jgi:hypothetical protein
MEDSWGNPTFDPAKYGVGGTRGLGVEFGGCGGDEAGEALVCGRMMG